MIGLRIAVQDGVGWITLDRPEALNALTFELVDGIAAQVSAWADDPEIDVVVIAGAGDRAFAAGADIPQLRAKTGVEMTRRGMQHAITAIRESSLPTVAAVNGIAYGGGFELALACDIRIAVPQAKFAFPEVGLGIIPGAGGTQMLTRITGSSVAAFQILTGRPMSADRAYQLGIVAAVHEPDELRTAAMEIAQGIRAKGPTAIRLAKAAIAAAQDTSMAAGLQVELLAQAVLFETADRDEGMAAFVERRQARFDGEARR